jgi:hypothetical protein
MSVTVVCVKESRSGTKIFIPPSYDSREQVRDLMEPNARIGGDMKRVRDLKALQVR